MCLDSVVISFLQALSEMFLGSLTYLFSLINLLLLFANLSLFLSRSLVVRLCWKNVYEAEFQRFLETNKVKCMLKII